MSGNVVIGLAAAGLMIIASVWVKLRKKKKNFVTNIGFESSSKEWGSYMTLKANRASARLLKDYTGIFGYSAPMKMESETNSGVIQTSEEKFYFRVQHGKKAAIYGAYSGEPISESVLEDLELNDKSAITPVWIKWEGK